jgi:GAF domain-containing protein
MRRRSRAGGEPTKAQRRKTATRKRRIAPKAVRPRGPSIAREETEVARLTRERDDALARQTATSEILRVISQSPTDARPVFDSIVLTAARLLRCDLVMVLLCDGATYWHGVVASPEGPVVDQGSKIFPIDPSANFPSRAIIDKKMLHLPDWSLIDLPEHELKIRKRFGVNSALYLPLLRGGECIGLLTLIGKRPNTFGAPEIAQAESFRDQALIAIENARLFDAEQQRTRELSESLEQQTATSEVLQVISTSSGELQPVFAAMLENAVRICGAKFGNIYRWEGDALRVVAAHNTPPAFAEFRRRSPLFRPHATTTGSMLATKAPVHIEDLAATPAYTERSSADTVAAVELGGARTALSVPMLREDEGVGAFVLFRQDVRPFTHKEIELVKNFAAQAVIAIENTRLLNELRESLQQQTATADVLKVVSRSTFDLQAVLDALVESAARLCAADKSAIQMRDGDVYRIRAHYGLPREAVQYAQLQPLRPGRNSVTGRVALDSKAIHVHDVLADPEYGATDYQQAFGYRTILGVPLLRDGTTIGVFAFQREEVSPFTDKQIELATTFADQAVIAIENTRLFEAEQQRTRELAESLEQQTATSKVLEVISRSAFDLQAVFETVAENSVKLCGADRALIFRFDGELLRIAMAYNTAPEFKKFLEQNPIRLGRHSSSARAALERRIIHIPDVWADPEYTYGARDAEAIHTVLSVPILKGDNLLGVMTIYHLEGIRPFTDKQIALVETFADQAAIAIDNVRLLDELRHRTEELGRSVGELRALGEVSQAVNSTLDLETVLSTIVAKAVQLSGTEAGAIYVFDAARSELRLRATYGMDQELIEALTKQHIGLEESNVARALTQREPVQIADLKEHALTAVNEIILHAGFRALLVAPLLRGEELVGTLVVRRRTPGTFAQSTVDLLKTFAAQSAVAIENARLFQDVETSLKDLRITQDRLVQTQKLASLGQLTAGIAHEIKNPLNFVNNFSGVSAELLDELREALSGVKADDKTRTEITELADTLHDNLNKIVQHGQRADLIVKNMLLHSREGSGDHRLVDINTLVEEAINLAFHGARAEKQGFNITLERTLDPAAGQVDCFPQEITRVLLNLISNGFYAATKRKAQVNGGYEPTLKAATRNLGDRVEIRIRDNGSGIPPEVRDKMFNPFFTTKPAGEGTGLGLSISYDIVVKQHEGSIEVDTQLGEFTEIRIILPRSAAHL